jgi:hypothetical protein
MPRRTRNWDALDEQGPVSNGDDVQYVGVVDDDGPSTVRPPRPRIRRRPPRPAAAKAGQAMAADTVLHMRPGSYISMNTDAARALHQAPVTEIGGKRVRRMQPGTYFVMAEDDDPVPTRAAMAGGMGTNGAQSWVSTIGGTVGDLFGTAWGAYQQHEQTQAQIEAQREQARLQREEAEAARAAAETAAERQHAARMAEIAAETEALARQAEARAAAAREGAIAPAAASTGMPGWAIALLAIGGVGAVGAIIWAVTRSKDKD